MKTETSNTQEKTNKSWIDAILAATEHATPNTVQAALRAGAVPNGAPEPQQELRRATLCAEVAALRGQVGELFGCEAAAKSRLEQHLNPLARELDRLDRHARSAAALYPTRLDPNVLRWRTEQGYPALALFDLGTPTVTVSWESNGRSVYRSGSSPCCTYTPWVYKATCTVSGLPKKLASHYDDLLPTLCQTFKNAPVTYASNAAMFRDADWRTKRQSGTLTCSFQGTIPEDARRRIRKAQDSKCFEAIYILAETPEWSVTATPAPIRTDPVALGWDGEHLHIITVFDLTPIEQLAVTQSAPTLM